jgi:hypothetical protein
MSDDVGLVLDLIDEKLLVNMLGIETEMCQQCRYVWRVYWRKRYANRIYKRQELPQAEICKN